jgi:hypothetical protein
MKYIKLFEKYNLNGRIYCICNLNSSSNPKSKKDLFTIDKYYDFYIQDSERSIYNAKYRAKDDNNKICELYILKEMDKQYLRRDTFYFNGLSLIEFLDESITTYWIYLSPVLFIKEEDVEKYELNRAIKNYNL